MAERVGPGWAEAAGRRDRDGWVFDAAAWRRANHMRGIARREGARWNAAASERERQEEEARRLADPLERAKSFLGRHLRVPVYAASVADGPEGMIVVGRHMFDAEGVLALARRHGWREDGSRPAPPPPAAAPAPKFAPPPGETIRSGEDDARGEASRTPPVLEASPHPDPAPNITPPQSEEGDKAMADFRNVSVHFRGPALAALEEIAQRDKVPYPTAARTLIDRALAGEPAAAAGVDLDPIWATARAITIPTPAAAFVVIKRLAHEENSSLGRAALVLIEEAIEARKWDGVNLQSIATYPVPDPEPGDDEPQPAAPAAPAPPAPAIDPYAHADGSRECRPAPLPIEQIATDALLAEIKRRTEQVDDPLLDEAIARAEAAERKLDTLRAALA